LLVSGSDWQVERAHNYTVSRLLCNDLSWLKKIIVPVQFTPLQSCELSKSESEDCAVIGSRRSSASVDLSTRECVFLLVLSQPNEPSITRCNAPAVATECPRVFLVSENGVGAACRFRNETEIENQARRDGSSDSSDM